MRHSSKPIRNEGVPAAADQLEPALRVPLWRRAFSQGIHADDPRLRESQLRSRQRVNVAKASVDDFIDAGLVSAGTPDMVFKQIKEFHDHVGGFGHLLMMAQGGHLSHQDTTANLKLFSKEALPHHSELG